MVHLAQVSLALTEAHLKVQIEKFYFASSQSRILGHQISANYMERNTKTIEAVLTFPTPKRVKDIRFFFELCNYCRRYVKNFCRISKPLHILLKKDAKFVWSTQTDLEGARWTHTPLVCNHLYFWDHFEKLQSV